jgi:hypothetical protein
MRDMPLHTHTGTTPSGGHRNMPSCVGARSPWDSTGTTLPSRPWWPRRPPNAMGPMKSQIDKPILLTWAKYSSPLSQKLLAQDGATDDSRPMI